MSRRIDTNQDGTQTITIDRMEDCKYMYNEVCRNAKSDQFADLPHREEYCLKRCPYFEKEDGNIKP